MFSFLEVMERWDPVQGKIVVGFTPTESRVNPHTQTGSTNYTD